MTTNDRTEFTRALRALPKREFVAFLAALWAARGWSTDVSASVITATRPETGARAVVRVVAGTVPFRAAADLRAASEVDFVVVRTPLAATVIAHQRTRLARRDGGSFDVLDSGALFERFQYSIPSGERDRLREDYLAGDHFRASIWSRFEATASVLGRVRGALSLRRDGPRAAAFALAILVAVVVANAGVVPYLSGLGSQQSAPTPQQSVSVTPFEPDTAAVAATVPEACPVPPTDGHPRALRPRVVSGVTASGLEGWEISFAMNLTSYDPNDYTSGEAPVSTHVTAYETPANRSYRLDIDRWQSAARAGRERNLTTDRGVDGLLVWGQYTVSVQALGEGDAASADSDVRELFAAVTTPSGAKLGFACADALS